MFPSRLSTFGAGALRFTLFAALLAAAIQPASAIDTPDRPEPGKQGETMEGEAHMLTIPYSKGVRVIGHNDIDKRTGNVITAFADHCTYVAGGLKMSPDGNIAKLPVGPTSGVAVIDASNPAAPRVMRYLQEKGALDAGETLNAVVTKGRSVLTASTYGGVAGVNGPKEGWLAVYDISDCANPKLMSEIKWPEPVHTLTVSPNGKRIYGTIISPFTGDGGLQVMDISDLARPRFVGKFSVTRPDGTSFAFAPHEVSISPDERRIYAGVIASKGGDLNAGIKLFPPNADGLGPEAGGIYILDNSDLVDGKADPQMRLVGTALHGGWHSAIQANIKGTPYLVGAGELGACPGSWPRITSIADEKSPRMVGQFKLQMNLKENCPSRDKMETGSNGVVGRDGTTSTHFNDVDSPTDTRLGLFPFIWAGLRIVDLRDPATPTEVAYFKPGDACMSHVRYKPKTGQIWFACKDSGFWIIDLKPELRTSLGLPKLTR
ncbi:MAG TPA: hypothetical protein VF503_07435 [Sphingobium sp.]|uniref:LVIVD repeat-containing protein n=1 Tax=Sphingobium sp. TaxID=1912891 RepID=UPI002ED5F407